MSCRFTMTHAADASDYFKPGDFAEFVSKERVWVEFLLRLAHQRVFQPEGAYDDIVTGMLRDQARWLGGLSGSFELAKAHTNATIKGGSPERRANSRLAAGADWI